MAGMQFTTGNRFGKICSWLAITMLLLSFCIIGGCNSVHTRAFNTMLAVGGEKEKMLHERIEYFNQALYWGDTNMAVSLVTPESRNEVYKKAKELRKSMHYVDLEVQEVNIKPDAESAEVVVGVQYYRTPSYVIKNRVERQNWVFNRFGGGWLLDELAVVPAAESEQHS